MWQFFKTIWATGGDIAAIPEATQPSGVVSQNQGFGFDYERVIGTDPDAKSIPRLSLNWLFNRITAVLQQYQVAGFPLFITTADNGGTPYPYEINATVRYDDGVNGFRNYYSLVNANTALPTDVTKWGIVQYRSGVPVAAVLEFFGITLPDGFVWANGTTIGSAASGATGRANNDTQDLYTALWGSLGNTQLPIQDSTGAASTRGISAAADFAANKRLPVPDKRDVASIGTTNMGGTAARGLVTLAGAGFDPAVLGNVGGAQGVALTSNQNGPHLHAATTSTAGAHVHTGTTTTAGDHFHAQALYSGGFNTGIDQALLRGGITGNTLNTNAAGAHAHTLNINSSGDHTHPITVASSGLGSTHLNVQPSIVCNFIIKL